MLVGKAVNKKTAVSMLGDSYEQTAELMEKLQTETLPVIDAASNKVLGQISREKLADTADPFITESDLDEAVMIFNNQHLFEAARMMLEHDIELLPVVDEQSLYLGLIQKEQLLGLLVTMLNVTGRGSVITIAMKPVDFTLSEVVQLIETEGAKIMGITVESPDADRDYFEISIKLNMKDAGQIVSALRRYEYNILAETNVKSQNLDLAMRADEFLRYLDM